MHLVKEINTKLETNTFLIEELDNWIGKNVQIILKAEENPLSFQYSLAKSESIDMIKEFQNVDSEGWENDY